MKAFCFLLFFYLLGLNVFSQDIESVKKKVYAELKPKTSEHFWRLRETKNQIELYYIDTFFINTSISPVRGSYSESDTLHIKIHFEENWNQKKVDSIRSTQKIILDSLSNKFISHHDSIQWKGIKLNKEMFLQNRYSLLLWWDGLTQTEKYQLKHFIRLPEKIIGTVGLFTESNYLHCGLEIQPESINIKVEAAYKSFAEVLGRAALYRCQDYY